MISDDLRPFDLSGPLPSGTTVLEASAGTGKTFTIAGLAARWVAETSTRLPELLVVTFTRAATAELRDRVRRRLVEGAEHLDRVLSGDDLAPEDVVLRCLADAPSDELRRRHERLTRAISDVDVATIATIHGFCQHVLDGLGIASDLDREAELVDDLHEIVEEVVDDLFVTTYHDETDKPRLTRQELVSLGRVVVANPTTPLGPSAPADAAAGLRLHLAQRIRSEVARRARRRRQLSYDELLTRLETTLGDRERGDAAREALRSRYRVTLIDEFQDTDPVQWSIVSRAFADATPEPGRALVLIGDPKQAIYAFRGADVHAYLDAAAEAQDARTLGTNWRSDAPLLRAFDALFGGARFGEHAIRYREVQPAPGHERSRLAGVPATAPLRLRLVPRHEPLTGRHGLLAQKVREHVARDVAADIVRLLGSDARRAGPSGELEPLAPHDVAVLVRQNAEASLVQRALLDLSVPAVIGGVESVFGSTAAIDWRRLLEALERPASSSRVRALALTAWVGWTGDDVATRSESDWDELHEQVHRWATVARERGIAATHRLILLEREVRPRVLGTEGGERFLADLEHVGELLHAAAAADQLGPTGLFAWLQERIAEATDDQQDERLRRLETDDEAVQILTIHRSKGLEFPVVYCPFLWSSNTRADDVPIYHDASGRRRIDVGGPGHPDFAASQERAESEARGEQLRLVYVALTRARHQVVAWYAPAGYSDWSGLARLILCRDEHGNLDTDQAAPTPEDDEIAAAAGRLAQRGDGCIAVETVPLAPSVEPWQRPEAARVGLDRARFGRTVDESWRRTSYSAVTRLDDPLPHVGSEVEEPVKDDEELTEAAVVTDGGDREPELRAVPSPLADLPGGTQVGTFVHRVLEHADFAADDLSAELARATEAEHSRRRLELEPQLLVTGLRAAIETPLGPAAGDIRLADVHRDHRLDEVDFELPLDLAADGRTATVGDLADLMRRHLRPDDPLAEYPDRIDPALLTRDLRGFLAGSIDLVLRRVGPGGETTFHVADYKTNRLGVWGEPLTAWDYRPSALVEAMVHGHYPIQALLYSVALHRLLRWRLPEYDPDRHLGAVLYLFVRGMIGPATPRVVGRPCGVFAWQPPSALIVAASDRLHGATGPTTAGGGR